MRVLEESHPTPLEECSEAQPLTLAELKTHETTLSDTVAQLESEHKDLVGQHHANLQQLHQLRKQLAETRQQFEQISQQYEALVLKNNDLVGQINSLTEKHHDELESLQAIRHQIQRLETVTICICDDGSIETFDGPEIELNDTGHEELYLSLLAQGSSLCQDLRLRDLKTIARVKSIIANSEHPLELLFEDNDLEEQYAKFN